MPIKSKQQEITKKRPPVIMVVFFLCMIFAAPDVSAGDGQKRHARDAYVSSGIGDARVLVPILADDVSSGSICELLYNGLTKVDRDLNVVPDLAEKWEVEDGGLKITFFLRKGVRWHDGEPFTSRDVEFTYRTVLAPSTGCPYISSYLDIEDIRTDGPYRITFRYSRPYAPALLKFGMGIIPEHIYGGGKDIRALARSLEPVGTGPYTFSRWESGQYIVLDANPDYFEGEPGIKKYVYRIIPDQAVQFLELVSEEIDSMDLNPYQYLYRSRTDKFRQRLNKYRYLAHSYTYIGYNLKDPIFADKRVRKALSLAVDRKELVEAVLMGLGEPCTGPFIKGTDHYDETVKGDAYDPEAARRLLMEAGWKDEDADGVLEKDGVQLRFTLATNQGNQVREDVATVVQDQWAKVGARVSIQVVAWSAFLDQFVNKKNFQAVLLGWTLPVDPDLYSVWHTDSSGQGGLNFISYSNVEVDQLIEAGRTQFDPDKRAQIYRRIHSIISGDFPYTFLFFPYATPAVNKRFKGIEPAPAGIGYNFIDWYVPEKEVKYKF